MKNETKTKFGADEKFVATSAESSGISVERARLKAFMRRSDRPGLLYLLRWAGLLVVIGGLVWLSIGTLWVWLALFIYGSAMCVPAMAFSHEAGHGTAFRTRWLNETVMWVTSLIFLQVPLHRRLTHTMHHTRTWYAGMDCEMPDELPMKFGAWLFEISGLLLLRYQILTLVQLTTCRYSTLLLNLAPENDLPKLTRGARIYLAIYAMIAVLIFVGQYWLLWFLVLPRLMGMPVMQLFIILQHAEVEENTPSILESTRSFNTNALGRFLYANMNFHIEHHLFPQVPFFALPDLSKEIRDDIPEPDPGFFKTNLEVLSVVARRSLGKNTKARSIRQAPAMIADAKVAES